VVTERGGSWFLSPKVYCPGVGNVYVHEPVADVELVAVTGV